MRISVTLIALQIEAQ